jgi:hypothetical protein
MQACDGLLVDEHAARRYATATRATLEWRTTTQVTIGQATGPSGLTRQRLPRHASAFSTSGSRRRLVNQEG